MSFAQVISVLAMTATTGIFAAPASGPIAIRVQFESPPGCSDSDVFYGGIRARSSRIRLAGTGQPATTLRVRVVRAGNKVQGELRIVDSQGEADTRQLDGFTCDEVVQALALTAALALDPNTVPSP